MQDDTWIDAYKQANPHLWPIGIFTPRSNRRAMLAVLAFDGELRRIALRVSEPMLGAIRFQWWRDTLQQGAGVVPRHPLARALCETAQSHRLAYASFEALIDAAQLRFDPASFQTQAGLQDCAQAVARAQGALMLKALSRGEDRSQRESSNIPKPLEDALHQGLFALEMLALITGGRSGAQVSEPQEKAQLLDAAQEAIARAGALSAGAPHWLRPALIAIPLGRFAFDDVRRVQRETDRGGNARLVPPLGLPLSPWRLAHLGWRAWRGRF